MFFNFSIPFQDFCQFFQAFKVHLQVFFAFFISSLLQFFTSLITIIFAIFWNIFASFLQIFLHIFLNLFACFFRNLLQLFQNLFQVFLPSFPKFLQTFLQTFCRSFFKSCKIFLNFEKILKNCSLISFSTKYF